MGPSRDVVGSGRRGLWLACAVILAALALAAYSDSFSCPFVFDDLPAIEDPSITSFATAFHPPPGVTSSGRPVMCLTLALNYAMGGRNVVGYHVFNLMVHIAAGLALFGLVRRSLCLPSLSGLSGVDPTLVALAISGLWLAHPLQTESVTYVVQRTESMMGMFYLLTFYAFVRSLDSAKPGWWQGLSVLFCLLGMGTKEVMVSAPVIVFFFDGILVSGSYMEAWKRRKGYYLALAGTWIPLAALVISLGGNRGGSTGGLGAHPGATLYWLSQTKAIVTYLRLAFWPRQLSFEYGTIWPRLSGGDWPCVVGVIALAAATAVALARRRVEGLLGLLFFAVLAPTSVVRGTTQMICEHRMYLSLVAPLALAVGYGVRVLGRTALYAAFAAVAVLAGLTFRRNEVYRSAVVLWGDAVAKHPDSMLAQASLGTALMNEPGRMNEAVQHLEYALTLSSTSGDLYTNLGSALAAIPGHEKEGTEALETAVSLQPRSALAQADLGCVLMRSLDKQDDAEKHLRLALQLNPRLALAHSALGSLLVSRADQHDEGMGHLEEAIRLEPEFAEGHLNLGVALSREPGRTEEAMREFELAARLNPNSAEAENDLGALLARAPWHQGDAIHAYESAIRLRPDYWQAHLNLGLLLLSVEGRTLDGISQLEDVVRIKPDNGAAHANLGVALASLPGRTDEAIRHFEEAARLDPGSTDAHFNLATVLARTPGRKAEAIDQYRAVLALSPRDADAEAGLRALGAGSGGRSPSDVKPGSPDR